MLEGQPVQPRRRGKAVAARSACKSKRLGSKGSVGVPSKKFQCEVCEIFVNSETQLSQVRRKTSDGRQWFHTGKREGRAREGGI